MRGDWGSTQHTFLTLLPGSMKMLDWKRRLHPSGPHSWLMRGHGFFFVLDRTSAVQGEVEKGPEGWEGEGQGALQVGRIEWGLGGQNGGNKGRDP